METTEEKTVKVLTPDNITSSDCKRLVRAMRPCYSCTDRRCKEKKCAPQVVVERVQTCIDFYYTFFGLKRTHKSLTPEEKKLAVTLLANILATDEVIEDIGKSIATSKKKDQVVDDKDDKSDIDYDFNQF